jgi:hypothetical protein
MIVSSRCRDTDLHVNPGARQISVQFSALHVSRDARQISMQDSALDVNRDARQLSVQRQCSSCESRCSPALGAETALCM